MSDEIADNIAATIAVLKQSSAVIAACAGVPRVAGGEVPAGWVRDMPMRGIVVVPAGGGGRPGSNDRVPVKVKRVDVRCYGRTPAEANTLALTVEHALQSWLSGIAGGVLVHWFNHASGPIAYRTADGDWPVAVSSFQMQFAKLRAE